MKKTYFVSTIVFTLVFSFLGNNLFAQSSKGTYSFYAEVIPYAVLYGGASDGFQAGIGKSFHRNKYKILLTYGSAKKTYQLSNLVTPTEINGRPFDGESTDASIFTLPNGRGAIDKSMYEMLEEAGIKHYKPNDGAYVKNYGTLEILSSHSIKKKWRFEWGFGGQLGLMNRTEFGASKYSGAINTLTIYRISARYIYYGITNRVSLTRKLSDHFSVGISSGVHLIMGKNTSIDNANPYIGLLAMCYI
jgi:hypothetical protein